MSTKTMKKLRHAVKFSATTRRSALHERLAAIAATTKRAPSNRAKKKRSANPDLELRREYHHYQDLKPVIIGVNTLLGWLDDYFTSSALKDYITSRQNPFSLTADLPKDALSIFNIDSKKIKLKTNKTMLEELKKKRGKKAEQGGADKLEIEASSILVKLETPKFEVHFNPLRLAPYDWRSDKADNERQRIAALKKFEDTFDELSKQFSALFSEKGTGFKFPNTMKVISGELGARTVVLNIKEFSSPLYAFNEFASEGGKSFTSRVIKASGIGTEMSDENMPHEDYSKMLEFQIHVDETSFRVPIDPDTLTRILADETLGGKLNDGTLTFNDLSTFAGSMPTIVFTPKIDTYVRYPMKYAMWATCARNKGEFSAPMFVDLHNTRITRATGSASNKTPTKWSGMNLVRDEISYYEREFGHKFKVRANEDGFAITKTARIVWMPQVDNADEYMSMMRSRFNKETGEVMPPAAVGLKNFPVLMDWKNSKFSYCDTNGNLAILDVSGCSPVTSANIYRELSAKMNELGDDVINDCHLFWIEHAPRLDPNNQIMKDVLAAVTKKYNGQAYSYAASFSELFKQVVSRPTLGRLTFGDVFGLKSDGELPELPRDKNQPIYFMVDVLKLGAQKLREVLEAGEHPIAMKNVIESAMFGAFLLTKYSDNMDEIAGAYMKAREANKLSDVNTDDYHPNMPNMPGLNFFMPHQANVVGSLEAKRPQFALLDIGAGGGKTIISISDIVISLNIGESKRPLVITKDNLVADYCTEINRVSLGQINAVPITTQAIETHVRAVDNMGEEFDVKSFVKWVKKFPLNTIFITGFNFVKKSDWSDQNLAMFRNMEMGAIRNKNEIVYGNYTGARYSEKINGETRVAFRPLTTFPMADMLALCDFDYVCVDEAHYIKETSSQVTQAVNNVLANANTRRWMSGTLVTDKARDLVGITSTMGALGDDESFRKKYMQGLKLKNGEATAAEIFDLIADKAAMTTKRRKEWSFVMPYLRENIHPAPMTPIQEEFYGKLLSMQEAEFKKEYEEILKGSGGGKDKEAAAEEDDALQARIEELLKATLYRLEIFMGAPDEDQPKSAGDLKLEKGLESLDSFSNYVSPTLGKVGPEDLVSPKVKIINKILDAHFNGAPYPGDKVKQDTGEFNKVLILSYNKPLSRHIMKHLAPQFKAMAIRFVAAPTEKDAGLDLIPGNQAIEKLKTDPKIKIMVADQASMQEGFNLQMASRLIEVQSVWSPGRMEQARARVVRPDPRDKFKREFVNIDVVASVTSDSERASVDYAKFARIVTKIITKAQIDYSKDPRWKQAMSRRFNPGGDLELPDGGLRMSPESISKLTPDKLEIYFHVYKEFIKWEQGEFRHVRDILKRKLQEKAPEGVIITDSDVKTLAMVKVNHATPLPGSKRVFSPFVFGQEIHDPLGLDLKSIVQSDADATSDADDAKEEGENIHVEPGMPCWTAYGPGRITTVLGLKVRVDCGEKLGKVLVPKGAAFVPTTKEGRRKFENLLNKIGPNGAPTIDRYGMPLPMQDFTKLDLNAKTPSKKYVAPVDDYEEDEDETPEEQLEDADNADSTKKEPDELLDITLRPLVINGSRAVLYVDGTEDRSQRDYFMSDFGKRGWMQVPDFIRIPIPNGLVLDDWKERLEEKYSIKSERLEYIDNVINQLKTKSKSLTVDDTAVNAVGAFKNFYQLTHKNLPKNQKTAGGEKTVRPWLCVFSKSAFLCFDVASHHPTLLTELHRMAVNIGKKRASVKEPVLIDFWALKFVSSVAQAKNEINAVASRTGYEVNEYDETIAEAEELGQVKLAPKKKIEPKPPAKSAKKTPAKKAVVKGKPGQIGKPKGKAGQIGAKKGDKPGVKKLKQAVKTVKKSGRIG